jgi:hypothetical protein
MLKYFVVLLFLFPGFQSFSQNKYTISGTVKDAKSGESLIGAILTIKESPGSGAATNSYGFYSLTMKEGDYTLQIQYLGYQTQILKLNLRQNHKQDFIMEENVATIKGVEITAEKKNINITNTEVGMQKMNIKEISSIPVLMGEKDVLKTLQLLPGIKSAGEGSSGFYVRGGAADQNLILLDEAIVFNASHLMGFFSVFNSDAIKDIAVYKAGMPAEYGGRLSSVVDIRMNEGSTKKYGLNGGIGLISSRLTFDGPIVKNKGSFIISGRRTYADLFLKLSKDTTLNKASLYFYDLNAKSNYEIDRKNRIFLSGYFGKDALGFGSRFGFNWGNTTATLRWNHLFNDKLFANTSLIYSNYDYVINLGTSANNLNIISRIQNYNAKMDYQYFPDANSKIKFGLNTAYYRILPGIITTESSSNSVSTSLTNRYGLENAVYFSHEFECATSLTLNYGIRLATFSLLGPGDFKTYDADGNINSLTSYSSNKFVKTYAYAEPRLLLNYILNEYSSLKASYARNTQNLHLLSNSTSGNPTDRWIPSSNNVKPEFSDQVSLGYFRNFSENTYECSAEVYYKDLKNQIDYKNGSQLAFNDNVEANLLFGKGRAYGLELFLKKKYGRFNGWISYTLSRSERKFDAINNGNYYAAKQDRTHDVSLVGIFELSKKWTFSATWVYYTGNAVTFPNGKYEVAGIVTNYYTERNAYRMPSYHRLDLGATWQRRKTEKFESSWTFSVYNAYARDNAYSITFEQDPNDPLKTQAVQTTLFNIIPSVTYNFKF